MSLREEILGYLKAGADPYELSYSNREITKECMELCKEGLIYPVMGPDYGKYESYWELKREAPSSESL